ncbi:MAG TPA: ATP-binding protein [Puia sp.]|jgi:signal transduction histidine kinase
MQDTYNEVIIVLIAGTIVSLVLTSVLVFILLFYQKKRFRHSQQMMELQSSIQQELLRTQLETREETFRQISEELHDNVGQQLSSTKILLVITERNLPEVPGTLKTATTTLAAAIQDLRSLSKALNKEWLEQFNLVDNLHREAERINLSRTVTISVDTPGNDIPLRPEAQIMLFRIIQEALQNGIRHAAASRISITVSWDTPGILIRITDNGRGFDKGITRVNGVGLINMTHRTKLLNGTIDWDPTPEGGTTVVISIPV